MKIKRKRNVYESDISSITDVDTTDDDDDFFLNRRKFTQDIKKAKTDDEVINDDKLKETFEKIDNDSSLSDTPIPIYEDYLKTKGSKRLKKHIKDKSLNQEIKHNTHNFICKFTVYEYHSIYFH